MPWREPTVPAGSERARALCGQEQAYRCPQVFENAVLPGEDAIQPGVGDRPFHNLSLVGYDIRLLCHPIGMFRQATGTVDGYALLVSIHRVAAAQAPDHWRFRIPHSDHRLQIASMPLDRQSRRGSIAPIARNSVLRSV